ncbi:hypothetical protein [Photobacterium atrarenae]|uniref:Lipoprotein n=1 Tax=Photobacterium atrarenae TaxID=865757 RepID=A0ABY5GL13_9GAMM|nr:hypothetical protein [Photobacterium atrarenae]UTV29008.1 hypothetical protein NNL38_07195 [Photobacterium atrarenae]
MLNKQGNIKVNIRVVSAILVAAISLAGCTGPMVKINDVDDTVASKVMLTTDKSVLKKEGVTIIGVVEATSCRHLLWEPDASEKNCIDQLKMKAHQVGANAIMFGAADKTSADFIPDDGINRNCWNTVDCRGVAIIDNSEN